MSRSSNLFIGIFGSFALSSFALVFVPQAQIGNLEPQYDAESHDVYPVKRVQGREVYASEGCVYCHTQQIRDRQNGEDIERGWGVRRTVARDYIYDQAPFLGSSRIGPDLANVGSKDWRNEPKEDNHRPAKRDRAWQYLHLYNPATVITESNMPPYRYLFEKKKITGQRSLEALNVPVDAGYQIVPKPAAVELVNYLLSLDSSHEVKEVKTQNGAGVAAK